MSRRVTMSSVDSCDRMKRPWAGQKEETNEEERPEFDPSNPLCPGVQRPSGKVITAAYKVVVTIIVK